MLSCIICFREPSPIIRVMTFKSFLLLHEASLSISTRTLILLCQCVGDPSVDPSNSFSHLFGTQLGPLCVATVTALSLLSQSAGIEKIIMACDDILTRVLDSNFPLHSDPDVVSVLRQKCIQRGIELVMPNCPSLVPAIQSRGYTALAELASSDANIAASVTTLITSDVPVLAIIRSIELLTQGLDIICASVTKQLRLSSDLTMAMSIQATFCRVNYHNCRRVWLPMIQLLLSLYDVAHRVALMPSICTLLEKVISSLAPVETPSGAQQAIADSTDLVILLTDALPQLSLDLVSIHLWSSPECLRVVTSLMM